MQCTAPARTISGVVTLLAMALVSLPLFAHHGTAASYDNGKELPGRAGNAE